MRSVCIDMNDRVDDFIAVGVSINEFNFTSINGIGKDLFVCLDCFSWLPYGMRNVPLIQCCANKVLKVRKLRSQNQFFVPLIKLSAIRNTITSPSKTNRAFKKSFIMP